MNIELLKKICTIPGAPGHEHKIRDFVQSELSPFADKIEVDNIGNLYVFRSGINNPERHTVAIAAHLDEIGFIVTHIDEKGFIRFHPLGGFDPKTLTAQRVIVHGKKDIMGVMGTKPIHVMTPEERLKLPQISDYFIDTGYTKSEIDEIISVGDVITRERELIEMGSCINCKSLDNRISVFILIEAFKLLKNVPYDTCAIFTVQEEMGARGAIVAAQTISPTISLALDTTIAFDVPGAKEQEMITRLGQGAAIKIIDSSIISDIRLVNFLKQLASENQIKFQTEVLTGGNTDAGPLQRGCKNGSVAGAISVPTRHIHQVIEMVHKDDVQACIDLVEIFISKINTLSL